MSTLNVANITDGTNSVGTEYVINGSAKSWVNFNSVTTSSITNSQNVSSLTDNGVGLFSYSHTNSFVNGDYAAVGSGGDDAVASEGIVATAGSNLTPTSPISSTQPVKFVNFAGTSLADGTHVNVSNFGDLA